MRLICCLLLCLISLPAAAQANFHLRGAAALQTGDETFRDIWNNGYGISADVSDFLFGGLGFIVQGHFVGFNIDTQALREVLSNLDATGGDVKIYGISAGFRYLTSDLARMGGYVEASGGIYSIRTGQIESEEFIETRAAASVTHFGIDIGAGFYAPLNPHFGLTVGPSFTMIFVGSGDNIHYVPLRLGLLVR